MHPPCSEDRGSVWLYDPDSGKEGMKGFCFLDRGLLAVAERAAVNAEVFAGNHAVTTPFLLKGKGF